MYPPTLDPAQAPPIDPSGAPPMDAAPASAPGPGLGPEPLELPPLTDDQRGAIKSWLSEADRETERYAPLWKKNLDAYAPPPETLAKDREEYEVNTNVDFRQAEQKKAQLWFDTAQVQLTPTEPLSDLTLSSMPLPDGSTKAQQLSAAISLHQTVLNQILGPDGVDAKRTIQAALLDVLVPAGWGVTHIGYTAYLKPVETTDPVTRMPTTVKVPVYEEFFWSRLSPKALMVPADFRSTDFDKAPWLAVKFKIPLSAARREYGHAIPEDYKGSVKNDTTPIRESDRTSEGVGSKYDPMVSGTHMYYYEPTLNAEAFHPKRICECVFLQGLDKEVRHRYSPYQSLDAEGRLTGDSMQGYPIHVLLLRDVPDDNHVPSDSAMTRPLTDELNQYRGQILKSRDASIPYAFYDEDILPPEKIERITNGKYGPLVPVEGGRLNAAQPPIIQGIKPQLSQETYVGQDIIERDIDRTLALGPNQSGAQNQSRRTATEVATMQSSVDTRLAGEQAAVVKFFCAGVRKLDALVQRFSDRKQTTQILGEDGQQLWLSWNKEQIAGRFAYTIKPDSQIHVDAAADRQQDLAFYNLTARDPFINRLELARRLATKYGFNPDKLVQPPPPQGPPKPNVQVRIQAQDLDPRLPQFPFAMEILQQSGYQISSETVQNAVMLAGRATAMGALPDDITPPKDSGMPKPQPEHPGAAEQTEPISKHAADRSGQLPGGGSPFAAAPE